MSAKRTFEEFRDAIASLPLSTTIDRTLLDNHQFTLVRDGNLSIVYAPFDYVNADAKVALVGVTPGWTQMHTSFVEARSGLEEGQSTIDILRRVKRVAAFSGTLRTNLVSMLDEIGLAEALGVNSTSVMFGEQAEHLLHATSAVRYPVFKAGKNYSGSAPPSCYSTSLWALSRPARYGARQDGTRNCRTARQIRRGRVAVSGRPEGHRRSPLPLRVSPSVGG